MRRFAVVLGIAALLAGALPSSAAAQNVPYDERPAYQRFLFTTAAIGVNVFPFSILPSILPFEPFKSANVSPLCLPGYVICKAAIAGFSAVVAAEQFLASGAGDIEQTKSLLNRGFGGDWYVTGRDLAGDHVPDPYPTAAGSSRGPTQSGFEPPPL